jgi:hypothetical protein
LRSIGVIDILISMSLYTGKDFNEKYAGINFVKLTNELENHNGLQYQTGYNADPLKFYPHGSCHPGGLYFCTESELFEWLDYGKSPMFYCRKVTIPDDAWVYDEGNKFKCNHFILGERVALSVLDVWSNHEYCIRAIEYNWKSLRFVKDQTPYICLEAILRDSMALEFVRDQTKKICVEAVRRNGSSLAYVKDQTKTICWEAVSNDGLALEFVKDQTDGICLEAVSNSGSALEFVKDQTEEICLAAVRQNGMALRFVKEKTDKICAAAQLMYI